MPNSLPRTVSVRVRWSGYGLLALAHLVAVVAAPTTWFADVTQILLMPLLAWGLVGAMGDVDRAPGRLEGLVLVALGCSWLGDTAPRFFGGDAAFLAMVGCFLLAQIAYIAAFLPYRRASLARRHPAAVAPYALAFLALLVLCWDGAGPLLGPVVVYGLALSAMALLASGLAAPATAGGALFFVSDGLIALGAFGGLDLSPDNSFWVMLTYVCGQGLLVLGVLRTAPPR